MSRGWQANIPGFIIYGIVFALIPAVHFINWIMRSLRDDDNVEAIISFMANNTPNLFDAFSELNFSGNFVLALVALNFGLGMLFLIGFHLCNWFMNAAAKNSTQVGFWMYFPLFVAAVLVFAASLVMAVYFYPDF